MIKNVKISRNDSLIFCEVEDEIIENNFSEFKQKNHKLFKDVKQEKNYGAVEDSQYIMYYLIDGNIVYSIITHKFFLSKLAFSFLANLNIYFRNWLKESNIPYSKLVEINEDNYFANFITYINSMKNKYQNIKIEKNNKKLNKEIIDIYKNTIKNINLFLENKKISNYNKDNYKNFGKAARNVIKKILFDKFSIFIGIGFYIFISILSYFNYIK